jgi:hypothetical protein
VKYRRVNELRTFLESSSKDKLFGRSRSVLRLNSMYVTCFYKYDGQTASSSSENARASVGRNQILPTAYYSAFSCVVTESTAGQLQGTGHVTDTQVTETEISTSLISNPTNGLLRCFYPLPSLTIFLRSVPYPVHLRTGYLPRSFGIKILDKFICPLSNFRSRSAR